MGRRNRNVEEGGAPKEENSNGGGRFNDMKKLSWCRQKGCKHRIDPSTLGSQSSRYAEKRGQRERVQRIRIVN